MSTLFNDLKYACRMLRKNPGFTAVAILILAVAIAANTSLFSVVNAVMLRPLPYRDPHRLVSLWERGVRFDEGFRARGNFRFLRENNQVFEDLAGYCARRLYVTGIARPHEIRACEVTTNLFPMLGVDPLLGRGFLPEDGEPNRPPVVVVSHEFWTNDLAGDANVIGQSLVFTTDPTDTESGTPCRVVGVMPRDFTFPFGRSVPLWRPLLLDERRSDSFPIPVFPLARLRADVTLERAHADLAVLAERLHPPSGQADTGRFGVTRLRDEIISGHRRLPLLLLGSAGLVLLIACANIANLLLARAVSRQYETAVRMALGASRMGVMRPMLTENLLLGITGGVLGLLLTTVTIKGWIGLCPADIPRLQETGIDLRVLGFALGISILTGLLFGMIPAWRTSGLGLGPILTQRAATRPVGLWPWRYAHHTLVASQITLSLILLTGAGLLIRTMVSLYNIPLGFRPDNTLAMQVVLPQAKYPETSHKNAFLQSLLEGLQALPDVQAAGAFINAYQIDHVFASQHGMDLDIFIPQQTASTYLVKGVDVTPDAFAAMGIDLLRGQTLTSEDPEAIVIDEALARQCFGSTDPIGKALMTHDPAGHNLLHTVVGVVKSVRSYQTAEPPRPVVYRLGQTFLGSAVVLIRSTRDPVHIIPAIDRLAGELDPDEFIKHLEPLGDNLSTMLMPRRFIMTLLTLFAGTALLLALVGLYSLLQYHTTQQTHNIGIRMALGAQRGDVVRSVLTQGLKLILIGIVVGVAGSVALTRVLSSLLYDVTPTDPATLVWVSGVLAMTAALASYLPARRAAKIDPMEALRYE